MEITVYCVKFSVLGLQENFAGEFNFDPFYQLGNRGYSCRHTALIPHVVLVLKLRMRRTSNHMGPTSSRRDASLSTETT
jgi:hypothetical protein